MASSHALFTGRKNLALGTAFAAYKLVVIVYLRQSDATQTVNPIMK